MDVNIPTTISTQQNFGAVFGRRQHASGTRGANGSSGGGTRSASLAGRPRFDAPVVNDGYRWWYIDARSDDGKHGLAIIAFIGSVFSPYYAAARKVGPANPLNHCALNVALYGGKRRWAMTERGLANVSQSADRFDVGSSSLQWEHDELVIDIDERCAPWPMPVKGRVRFTPDHLYTDHMVLDADAQHFWQAVAPKGRIVVEFEKPGLSWVGAAYHDMNWGLIPLEKSFKNWQWSRVLTPNGTQVFYDLDRRDGSTLVFGQNFDRGCITERAVPPHHRLSPGFWGMSRVVNSEAKPQLLNRLEDTPFYTRNHVAITVDGVAREAYHESLSLDRFTHPLVQRMLPYKMPRVS